jgi:hypothetical protein
MTEQDWLTAADPQAMLTWLRTTGWLSERRDPNPLLKVVSGRAKERKVRLFLCACCRRLWHLYSREEVRAALATAEDYADGRADRDRLRAALYAIHKARGAAPLSSRWEKALQAAGSAAVGDITLAALRGAPSEAGRAVALDAQARQAVPPAEEQALLRRESQAQCDLLRDLVRPFRPTEVDPAWLAWDGGVVRSLAEAAYEQRSLPEGTLDPARLAVLADALEEAGCDDRDILGHLRGPGPHVRGCRPLDLLLDKG